MALTSRRRVSGLRCDSRATAQPGAVNTDNAVCRTASATYGKADRQNVYH